MRITESKIENLDDFQGWEQGSGDIDFFKELSNDDVLNPEESEILDEEEEEEEKKDSPTKDNKEKKKAPQDFFSDIEEEEDEEEDEEEGEGNEDEELEENDAEDFLESKFEEAISSRIESLFEDLPDSVKQLNSFVLKGGDVNEFIKHLSNSSSRNITKGMDLEDEDGQELVVREMMLKEGNDEELIDAQIEFLKDSGKLKMFAKGSYNKWEKENAKKLEQLNREQEERDREIKEGIKKTKMKMSSYLSERSEIGGVQLSKNDAREIPNYVNDRVVKLQNGGYISQLQKELYYDLPQNEEAYLQLATLMKNRNKDGTFNFDAVYENVNTKVTQKVKNGMRRKDKLPSNKNVNQKSRRLSDFFND